MSREEKRRKALRRRRRIPPRECEWRAQEASGPNARRALPLLERRRREGRKRRSDRAAKCRERHSRPPYKVLWGEEEGCKCQSEPKRVSIVQSRSRDKPNGSGTGVCYCFILTKSLSPRQALLSVTKPVRARLVPDRRTCEGARSSFQLLDRIKNNNTAAAAAPLPFVQVHCAMLPPSPPPHATRITNQSSLTEWSRRGREWQEGIHRTEKA